MIKYYLKDYEVKHENSYEIIATFQTLEEAISYLNTLKNKDDYYISTPSGEIIYL